MEIKRVFDQNLNDVTDSILIHKKTKNEYKLIGETETHKFILDQINGNNKLIVSQDKIQREYFLKD